MQCIFRPSQHWTVFFSSSIYIVCSPCCVSFCHSVAHLVKYWHNSRFSLPQAQATSRDHLTHIDIQTISRMSILSWMSMLSSCLQFVWFSFLNMTIWYLLICWMVIRGIMYVFLFFLRWNANGQINVGCGVYACLFGVNILWGLSL